MRKSQIALEFMLMLLIVILVTSFIAGIAYYYIADYSEERNIRRFQELGYSLQNEVILAYTVEHGYSREIIVPLEIEGYPVYITGTQNDIILTYKGSDILFRIPPVFGQFSTGSNTIRKMENGNVVIT